MVPLRMRFRRLLRGALRSVDRRARAFGGDLLRLWPALWTYVRLEGVESTNNRVNVGGKGTRPPTLEKGPTAGVHSGVAPPFGSGSECVKSPASRFSFSR